MKFLLAIVFALTSTVVSAQETKTSPWSLKLLFDNYNLRDEVYKEGHKNYKRIDGFQSDIYTVIGRKIDDKNSFSLTNFQGYQNKRSKENERGTWFSTYLTYNRSKLLEQDSHLVNLNGFLRLYRYVNTTDSWDRSINDTTPYIVRTGLSFSRDFGGIFGLAFDPYFQWYIRETGANATSKWRIAYGITPSVTINDMWSVAAPVYYYYTRKIVHNKADKTQRERAIRWEFVPTVSTTWTKSFSTDVYYQLPTVAQSHDGKSMLVRNATDDSIYGLVLNFNVF